MNSVIINSMEALIYISTGFLIFRSSARLVMIVKEKSNKPDRDKRLIPFEIAILFIALLNLCITLFGIANSSFNTTVYIISVVVLISIAISSFISARWRKKILFIPLMCVPGITIASIVLLLGALLVK